MNYRLTTSTFWGVILIGLGAGFLLDTLNIINFSQLISLYWPVLLLLLALNELSSNRWVTALILGILGLGLQLDRLEVIDFNVWSVFWPVVLMIIGATLLIRSSESRSAVRETSQTVEATAIFGGVEKHADTKSFKAGNVSAIFGGAKLTLNQAAIDSAGAVIDVLVLFGGAELIVPRESAVKIETVSIFGGVDDKRTARASLDSDQPKLRIRGTILFGGLELRD